MTCDLYDRSGRLIRSEYNSQKSGEHYQYDDYVYDGMRIISCIKTDLIHNTVQTVECEYERQNLDGEECYLRLSDAIVTTTNSDGVKEEKIVQKSFCRV